MTSIRDNVAVLMFAWTVFWSVGSVWVTWWIGRSRAAKSELAGLREAVAKKADAASVECKADAASVARHEEKLTQHDRRVQKLEDTVAAMPTLNIFHELALDFQRLDGRLNVIGESLKANTDATRRIEDYLMENRK